MRKNIETTSTVIYDIESEVVRPWSSLQPFSKTVTDWSADRNRLLGYVDNTTKRNTDGAQIQDEADMHIMTSTGQYSRRITFDAYRYLHAVAWSEDDRYILTKGIPHDHGDVYRRHILLVDMESDTFESFVPFPGHNNEPVSWKKD